MTQWCHCNLIDDRKVIKKVEENCPQTKAEEAELFTSLYKHCRSGCKSPCGPNVMACIRKHAGEARAKNAEADAETEAA